MESCLANFNRPTSLHIARIAICHLTLALSLSSLCVGDGGQHIWTGPRNGWSYIGQGIDIDVEPFSTP